jgi:predicted nucleic acid-binding Zn ribbon protein
MNKGWHMAPSSAACATIMEREQSRMNIFTIIGVVVVVILVAGYFGVHGVSF